MGKIKYLIIFTLLILLSREAFAQKITIRGMSSCGSWVEEETKHKAPGSYINTRRTWVVGYLSGLAVASDVNFWGEQNINILDPSSVYLWIDNYCRTNPLKDIADASSALFLERIGNK